MPILHLLVGPNGAGKTTFFERVLAPITHLPFINADILARQHWPGDEEAHGHDAAALARQARDVAIAERRSFVGETVFSHPSKLDLVRQAQSAGYLVTLHVILVPLELSLARVQLRSQQGGHSVPEDKVRERYQRLWVLVAQAMRMADTASVYDNSNSRTPYQRVARFEKGRLLGPAHYPAWSAPQAALWTQES
ncbi:MAG: zeta toxin family protein [Leptothrix ochracea]|uniref:zeta toxin family protein n=1 Tax=Leptothrix ochracea TaxID=735331 RepID=UPI0034E1D70E